MTRYIRSRYFCMRQGWGRPMFRPLWLEAIVHGLLRTWRFHSRKFNRWCDEVDEIYREQYNWPCNYTIASGRDCWIDSYARGCSPEEAVDDEVSHWEE